MVYDPAAHICAFILRLAAAAAGQACDTGRARRMGVRRCWDCAFLFREAASELDGADYI
jgi:hypothetical protein